MAIHNSFNFRQPAALVSTSGVVGASRIRGLAAEGYQVLINLLPDDSEYAIADEAVVVRQQGVEYIYLPVDFAAPKDSDFAHFTAAMDRVAGRKLHVHCAANYRVSAFYALYAEARGDWSRAQADAHIADLWRPADFPAWQDLLDRVRARFTGEGPAAR